MAERKVNVKILGDASSLQRAFKKAGSSAKTFGGSLGFIRKSLVAGGIGGALGLGGLTVGLASVARAAADAEASQAKLAQQLKASGLAGRANTKQIEALVDASSRLAAVDDEEVRDAFTGLVRVTKDVNKAMKLNRLALDVARGRNIALKDAALLVGKVYNGNVGILSRYGIKLEKGTKSTEALAELQKRFAGQAKAFGDTSAGAFDRFHVAIENAKEAIGRGFLPVITRAANWISTKLADPQVVARIEKLSAALGEKLSRGLSSIANWVQKNGDGIRDTFTAIGSGLKIAADAAKLLYSMLKKIADIVPGQGTSDLLTLLFGATALKVLLKRKGIGGVASGAAGAAKKAKAAVTGKKGGGVGGAGGAGAGTAGLPTGKTPAPGVGQAARGALGGLVIIGAGSNLGQAGLALVNGKWRMTDPRTGEPGDTVSASAVGKLAPANMIHDLALMVVEAIKKTPAGKGERLELFRENEKLLQRGLTEAQFNDIGRFLYPNGVPPEPTREMSSTGVVVSGDLNLYGIQNPKQFLAELQKIRNTGSAQQRGRHPGAQIGLR